MPNSISVDLPYNLKPDQLKVESTVSLFSAMEFLMDEVSWSDEVTVERLMRAAVVLKAANPTVPFGNCLDTALIWERG